MQSPDGRILTIVGDNLRGASEQAGALQEVNLGLAQLDQVTQQNAAMAAESDAASRGVADEATGIDEVISRFSTEPHTSARLIQFWAAA